MRSHLLVLFFSCLWWVLFILAFKIFSSYLAFIVFYMIRLWVDLFLFTLLRILKCLDTFFFHQICVILLKKKKLSFFLSFWCTCYMHDGKFSDVLHFSEALLIFPSSLFLCSSDHITSIYLSSSLLVLLLPVQIYYEPLMSFSLQLL